MTLKAGNAQEAFTGSAVPIAPSVMVIDAGGSAVAGVPVTFQVTSGDGSVTPTTPINTDAQGTATVASWTLGTSPGSNTLSASAAGVTGSPVIFTATALTGTTIRGTITLSNELVSVRAPRAATKTKLGLRPIQAARRGVRQSKRASDELIVRFRSRYLGAPARGASPLAFRASAARIGGEIRARMAPYVSSQAVALTGVSPAILAARVRVKYPGDPARVAADLRKDPAVASVEANRARWSGSAGGPAAVLARTPPTTSNDPVGVIQAWHYGMIDVPEAWSITTGSPGVLVAIVDDGLRFDHPDLAANLTSDGYDFVSDSPELQLCSGGTLEPSGDGDGYDPDPTTPTPYVYDVSMDCVTEPIRLHGAGVASAGIIGGVGNNAVGIAGINWSVQIRPVRVRPIHGVATGYDVAQGILYAAGLPADNGAGGSVQAPSAARIINLNLSSPDDEAVVRDAVAAATSAGSLIVAPAGFRFASASDPEYPGAYPEVLAVSAVGATRELTEFTSFGSSVDLAAPGGGFLTTNLTFGVGSTAWDFLTEAPDYAFWLGTLAVPHVAGVAALLLAQTPGMSAAELRSRLTDWAVDAGAPGRDDQYGAGILNARNSLAQNLEPPRQLHARLYDALAGGVVQTVAPASDGSYSFTVNPGSYYVYAGQDDNGDGEIGLPGRRWGAFGGSGRPSRIDATSGGSQDASFLVGFASEREPNEVVAEANFLPVGGYVSGVVATSLEEGGADTDVFRVLVPQEGVYTFETFAIDGACGLALEEDTVLSLHGADDSEIEVSDDIDLDALNFCSRIITTLQPGTYYLKIQGYLAARYQLQARSGA